MENKCCELCKCKDAYNCCENKYCPCHSSPKEEKSKKQQEEEYSDKNDWTNHYGKPLYPKKEAIEGIVTSYVQAGQTIECGNCHQEKYENCKSITEKYPHIICNCKCHSPKVSELEEAKSKVFKLIGKLDNGSHSSSQLQSIDESITELISSLISSTEKRVKEEERSKQFTQITELVLRAKKNMAKEIVGEIEKIEALSNHEINMKGEIINLIKSKYEN